MGVGMPYSLLLQEFGEHVFRAFGHMSYHVGSSLTDKSGWRDVDVRLMLPDEEYARMELGDPERAHENKRWVSLVLAWSAFGKSLTGLPIDFQIQQSTHANATNPGKRSALFTVCNLERPPAATRVNQIETLIKSIVISWDAEQDQEFDEALTRAREFMGFKLAERTEGPRG